ncbi:uncharacterized protein LOC143352229 [Halictus rubicundus]|uniref:uncharacterized protein LOC143352229 n=1 Tax=Halictus rubicundus TaxID=77578 RepID=UPI004035016D
MAKREIISSNSLTRDSDYKKDVDLSIEWNRWILKPMGVWPGLRHVSPLEVCFKRLMNVVCYSLISFLFAPTYLYMLLEVEEFYEKLVLYGPLIFCVMAYVKYYSLIVHANDIRECIKCIEWDWRNVRHSEDRGIMVANANFGRRLMKICSFFMFSGFVFYNIMVPINVGKMTIDGGNRTFIPLRFPVSKLIVDTQHNPTNPIFFSIQFFGAFLIHAIAAGACCLIAAFAVHACGQMQVLICWLKHLVDGRGDMSNSTNRRIAKIVRQHVRIQKFLTVVEKALTQISLVEFFGCTVDICLLGYYIIVETRARDMTAVATYVLILASLIFNIFIFCYIGELVAEQCKNVGQMTYMIDWYRLPENTKLSVVLIMAMSNSPTKLTAGSLVKLSLVSFSDVMKTSVAFLNMLRTLTDTTHNIVERLNSEIHLYCLRQLYYYRESNESEMVKEIMRDPLLALVIVKERALVFAGNGETQKEDRPFLKGTTILSSRDCVIPSSRYCLRAKTMAKREIISSNSLTRDSDYKKDVDLSIEWNRWILKPMGVWPCSRHVSKLEVFFNRLINAVCYSLISFLFAPCYLYLTLEVEEFYDKLVLYGPLVFCVMAYVKYYSLMVHANDIRECIKCIERDWRNVSHAEDREIMVANANFGRRLVKICSFFMFSGFVFYYIAVPMNVGKIMVEGGNRTFIPLVFPVSKLIVDTQHNPTNQIFFSIQFFGGMLIHAIAAGACCLAASFAVHACGQMQVLMCWMTHLVDGRVDMSNTTNGRIAMIVRQHVRIQKFLTVMEKALTQVSLAEFFGCTVDICLLGYYIIVESRAKDMTAVVTYAIILSSLVFNIFIFCYLGELVAEQCRKVGQMSYMIDWYRLPENTKLSLVLIMAMSSSPTKLTAGSLVKLSLASFSDVMKTSVAFLNMLRTLTDASE